MNFKIAKSVPSMQCKYLVKLCMQWCYMLTKQLYRPRYRRKSLWTSAPDNVLYISLRRYCSRLVLAASARCKHATCATPPPPAAAAALYYCAQFMRRTATNINLDASRHSTTRHDCDFTCKCFKSQCRNAPSPFTPALAILFTSRSLRWNPVYDR